MTSAEYTEMALIAVRHCPRMLARLAVLLDMDMTRQVPAFNRQRPNPKGKRHDRR